MGELRLLNPADGFDQMAEIAKLSGGDPESAHSQADSVLCAVLNYLGYRDLVEEFHKVEKWYA